MTLLLLWLAAPLVVRRRARTVAACRPRGIDGPQRPHRVSGFPLFHCAPCLCGLAQTLFLVRLEIPDLRDRLGAGFQQLREQVVMHVEAHVPLLPALPVEVEVDVSPSALPKTLLVGLPEAAVKESTHRVERAIVNSGFLRPQDRVVINLALAELLK